MRVQYSLPFTKTRFAFYREVSYPLYAQPDRNGFFGLRELRDYANTILAPYSRAVEGALFVLDFSLVKIWDIAALLWLIVALHHYRQQGFYFQLKLPESNSDMSEKDIEDFDKSADYLRRWRFEVGLQNLVPDPDALLVSEQRGYFSRGPLRFYRERKYDVGGGVLETLISQRLVGIRNLSDIYTSGPKLISNRLIAECIASFQSARIGDILNIQCGIEKRKADLFADHILSEGLMNVKEHPNATIGMIAISIMGKTNELILAMVDNGDSIPKTIYPTWVDQQVRSHEKKLSLTQAYRKDALTDSDRVKITHFATMPGVSSKKVRGDKDKEVGWGLTYIRNDTVDTFGGKLRIITDSDMITYQRLSSDYPKGEPWPHPWKGNLLRIAIPLGKKESI